MSSVLTSLRRWPQCLSIYIAAFAFPLAADGSLADALLAADSASRAALLAGHPQAEIAQALAEIEKTGVTRTGARDFAAALAAYQAALDVAHASGIVARVPYYTRQIGIRQSGFGHVDLALEVYKLGVAAGENGPDKGILAENLHGVALALHRLGRYPESIPYSERECALVENGQPLEIARAIVTFAAGLQNVGRVREALAIYERAVDVTRKSVDLQMQLPPLVNLALLYSGLGENETALRLMRDVIARRVPAEPLDFVNVGIIEHDAHHPDAAAEAYQKALALSNDPRFWQERGAALIDLAMLENERGQLREARGHLAESLQVGKEHGSLNVQSASWNELSSISIDEGDLAGALEAAAKALDAARASGALVEMEDALQTDGKALEKAGRGEEAGRVYAEAIDVVEAMRVETPSFAPGLAASLEHWMPSYQGAVRNALKAGKTTEALQLSESAKARLLLDMLEGGAQGLDAYLTAPERAEMKRLTDEVSRVRHAYLASDGKASRHPLADAERAAEAYEQRLVSRHPELVLQSAAIPQLNPAQLSALVPDRRTAVLDYFFLGEKQLALFIVRAAAKPDEPAVKALILPFDAALAAQAVAFRQRIAARDLAYQPAARRLFDALIAPAAAQLAGADRWIVSPSSSLWDVPFQALIDSDGKHVLETHSLSFAPSLSSLWMLRERSRQLRPVSVPLLVLANPALKGAQPIPEAESELRGIVHLYGAGRSVALTGPAAAVAAFREKAASAAVIHLAAHAEIDPQHPLDSFLALTPGPAKGDDGALTGRQILSVRLHAGLVVLSACETARGEITQSEGILGLGWAFEAAGASAAVLSQWKVDSAATRDLMIEFHRTLIAARGAGKAEALRQASLATMRMPGRKHPFYWAAFILAGDGR